MVVAGLFAAWYSAMNVESYMFGAHRDPKDGQPLHLSCFQQRGDSSLTMKFESRKLGLTRSTATLAIATARWISSRHLLPAWMLSVIPDSDGMIAGEGSQHNLESCQPLGILMTIADEHLRARWCSHGVPPFLTAEEQLTHRDVPFGSGF